MDESNDSIRLDERVSHRMVTSTPMKRQQSNSDDEETDGKRQKVQQSPPSPTPMKRYFEIGRLEETWKCPEIRGRLSQVLNWVPDKDGDGELMNFRIKDDSEEIRGLVFKPQPPYFHENFKVGAIVTLKWARVQVARDSHRSQGFKALQIVVTPRTRMNIEYRSPTKSKFVRKFISEIIENSNQQDLVDVVGIIENVGEIASNTMREIRITDESEMAITLTLWDDASKNFAGSIGSVIAARNVAVKFYRSVKCLRSCHLTKIRIDPRSGLTESLKKWYSQWLAPSSSSQRSQQPTPITNDDDDDDDEDDDKDKDDIDVDYDEADNDAHHNEKEDDDDDNDTKINESKNRAVFTTIKKIQETSVTESQNLIGIVCSWGVLDNMKTTSGKIMPMRLITLRDEERRKIQLEIWGYQVRKIQMPENSVLMVKHVKVRNFNNEKRLTCLVTDLTMNPDIPEAKRLKKIIADETNAKKNEKSTIIESSEPLASQRVTSIQEIIQSCEPGSRHNIVALVTKSNLPKEQITKSGQANWMRVVVVTDDEENEIELTVWGRAVSYNKIPINSVIKANDVMIREFNYQKSLSCLWANVKIERDNGQTSWRRKLIPKTSTINETKNDAVVVGESSRPSTSTWSNMKFRKIQELKKPEAANSRHDVIGFVTFCAKPQEVKVKNGNMLWMREIILRDENDDILMAVWGNQVKENSIPIKSVITAKNVTIAEYFTCKKLSCLWCNLEINPNIREAASIGKLAKKYQYDPNPTSLKSLERQMKECQRSQQWIDMGMFENFDPENPDCSSTLSKVQKSNSIRKSNPAVAGKSNIRDKENIPPKVATSLGKIRDTGYGKKMDNYVPIEIIGSKGIASMKKILEKAKIGEKIAILAVVKGRPERIYGYLDGNDLMADVDDIIRTIEEGGRRFKNVPVIDSSSKSMFIRVPLSIIKKLKNNSGEANMIRATNVKVCKFGDKLQLFCMEKESWLQYKPPTQAAKQLKEWYAQKKSRDDTRESGTWSQILLEPSSSMEDDEHDELTDDLFQG